MREAGATGVEAVVIHALASQVDLDHLAAQGISRLRATDSISGPATAILLAPVLARAVRELA